MSGQYWGEKTYSQHGEDLMILNLFKLMGIDRPSYLDIGAHHPVDISNTALLYERGCRGVNVEANPYNIADFKVHRPEDVNVNVGVGPHNGKMEFYMFDEHCGLNTFDRKTAKLQESRGMKVSEVREIEVITLAEVLKRYCGGVFPDLLSIDIEGFDLPVLESYHEYIVKGPKVICVEAQDKETTRAIKDHLISRGYETACRMQANLIFVQSKELWW